MTAVTQPELPSEDSGVEPVAPLIGLLDDLAAVLMQMPSPAYAARPLPGVSGSIGAHVRHVVDHVAAVAAATPFGPLTYDRRERGTAVESDPSVALRALFRLKAALTSMDVSRLDAPVTVSTVLVHGGAPTISSSTLRRELAFVVQHTIHHQALIAVLLALAGQQVADDFGLAPSTPRLVRD